MKLSLRFPMTRVSAGDCSRVPSPGNDSSSVRTSGGRYVLWLAAAVLIPAAAGRGETLLRWKFQPGETLRYEFRQGSRTETTGAGRPTRVDLELSMRLTWTVDSVDEAGVATLAQSIEKLGLTMKADDTAPVVYDSSARPPASGPAKEIAEAVGGLIGAPCTVRLNARGEILAVEPGEQLRSAWERNPAGDLFTAEGLIRMIRQASTVLPEQAVSPDAQWTAMQDVPTPLGKLQLASRFTFAGPEDRNGTMVEKIAAQTVMQLAPPPDPKGSAARLKEGEQSGTLWFDNQQGRFVESQFQQVLVSERPYRDMLIRVRSTSTMEMRLLPASP